MATLIHPTVVKSRDLIADPGVVILLGVHISFDVKIGKCCLLTYNAVLGHNSKVGEYSSILTSAILNGNCIVGDNCFIGAGAVLHQGVKIGNGSLVGMGTIIPKDVGDNTSVIDIPRKTIMKRQ